MLLPDLKPQTWYQLRITAHNDAGSSQGHYAFATKTRAGGNFLYRGSFS